MTLFILTVTSWAMATTILSHILGRSNKATIVAAIVAAVGLTLIASALP